MGIQAPPAVSALQLGTPAGYAHPSYVQSLADFGTPRLLPRSQGWILVRRVPGHSCLDAMGPYPLFACVDWSMLAHDLEELSDELLTLAVVPDPFGDHNEADLRKCFEVVRVWKPRYVVDLSYPTRPIGKARHRTYARAALRHVSVESHPTPAALAREWAELYAELIRRHRLTGIKAFSPRCLAAQLSVPGMVAFVARRQGAAVAMQLWLVHDDVAYFHLGASSAEGYRIRASYALQLVASDWFVGKVRWLDLGAAAGTGPGGSGGLAQFKRGWSTGTRPTYFCARVFDDVRYADVLHASGVAETDYFPAYRRGELA